MELRTHLEGVRESMVAFVRHVDRAGLDAPVPTAGTWRVRDLLAHQSAVHRWVAALLAGREPTPDAYEVQGRAALDPVEWLRDGVIELVTTLGAAPADVVAPVFLADAGPPREFWARRQCHETTVHAVDALSAALGRVPVAAEAGWISEEVALDGIDEMLCGFVPRPMSRLRAPEPRRLLVAPAGSVRRWLVEISPAVPRVRRLEAGDDPDADVELVGGARALYLALWNRGDEVSPAADDGWDPWREHLAS